MRIFKADKMTEFKSKLYKIFGAQKINLNSCIYLDDGDEHLTAYMKKYKPKVILEIGTFNGVSSALMSQYAKKIYTMDILDRPIRNRIYKALNINNVDFKLVENNEDKKKYIKELFEKENIDFVFIDGNHWGEEVAIDFYATEQCKKILFHDYSPAFPGVYDFVNGRQGWTRDIRGTFCLLKKGEGNARRGAKQRKNRI